MRSAQRSAPARGSVLRWLWGGAAAAAVVALVLILVARALSPAPNAGQALVGTPAPDFTLAAEQGGTPLPQPIALRPLDGRPTLLVFFFSLCPHCLGTLASVHSVTTGTGAPAVRVLYISSPAERPEIASAYVARLGITAPVLLDEQARVAERFGLPYTPAVVLLDAQGVVRATWIGDLRAEPVQRALASLSAPTPVGR